MGNPWTGPNDFNRFGITDLSGTVTLGSTSQVVDPDNLNRNYFFAQNPISATETLFIKYKTAAGVSNGSINLGPGDAIEQHVSTGITFDSINITAYVSKDYGAVTVLADTTATELDATNCKGYYLFDAAQAETNADCLLVSAKSSTANIVVIGAPAVMFTRPTTGYLAPATLGRTLVVDASGLADANTVKLGPTGSGTAQTARDVGASVLLSTGTGTGQLDFTSGVVKANLAQILGTALTETSGQIAAGFKKFFNIATPAATMDHGVLVDTVTTYTGNTVQTGDAYARIGAAGAGLTALGDTRIANLDATVSSRMATFTLPTNFSALVIDSTGRVNAFLIGILTSVFTEGATGLIAAAFKQFFNIASPAATMDHGILVDTVTTATTATALTTNNDKTGYTIASGGIGSGAHAAAELNNIADGCLDRRLDLGTDSGGNTTTSRTWRQALFGLRNKATIIAGTGTIYKCNDTTVSHTMAMGTTPGDPLSSQDPA